MQRLVVSCLLFLFSVVTFAETVLSGRAVSIADGDTLTLLVENRQVKVRLAEIDAPEKRQPFGTKARHALAALAFGNEARIVVIDIDRYKRTVGRVYVGDTDVNTELVRQGFARAGSAGLRPC